jgi:hypothetical protein
VRSLPARRAFRWPRTNDLGALDLSARSGADRIYDAIADRQIWRGVASLIGAYGSVTAVPSRFGVVDHWKWSAERCWNARAWVETRARRRVDLRDHPEVPSLTLYRSLSC